MKMSRWLAVLVLFVAGVGGFYYYERHYTVVRVAPPAVSNQVVVVQPSPSKEDLNKKRVEGIGSIKDLKPVPLPSGAGSESK